jgi:GLPGLI family protein
MKRLILSGAALFLLVLGATAQQPDAAQLVIHYKFIHVRDTNNRAHPFTQDMVLLAGKRASVYKATPRPQNGTAPPGLPTPKMGTEYYLFPNEKKMIRIEGLFNAYLIAEVFPVVDWHITGDTATKGGLYCQKATAHYKGRNYTAWFCPSLPLHAGPWKLNGLPGVIVEAYDAKKEVQFYFAGLDKATSADVIKLPNDAIKTTEAELARLKVTAQKNPDAFSKALTIQAGGVPGKSGPQIDMKPAPEPVINNPIELSEKK